MEKKEKTIKETRQEKGQRYSTIDLFNDLREKHGGVGGGFFDWLKADARSAKS